MSNLQFTIKYNPAILSLSVTAMVDGQPKEVNLSESSEKLQLQFARLVDGIVFDELQTALVDVEQDGKQDGK